MDTFVNILANLVVLSILAWGATLIGEHFHDWGVGIGIYLVVTMAVWMRKLSQ